MERGVRTEMFGPPCCQLSLMKIAMIPAFPSGLHLLVYNVYSFLLTTRTLRFLSVSVLSFLIWTTLESSQIRLSRHPHCLHTLHLFLYMKGAWGEMAISNFILFPFYPVWSKIYFLPLFSSLGFPDNSVVKGSACNAGDRGSIPGSGRFPGKWISYPLQHSWVSLWLSW